MNAMNGMGVGTWLGSFGLLGNDNLRDTAKTQFTCQDSVGKYSIFQARPIRLPFRPRVALPSRRLPRFGPPHPAILMESSPHSLDSMNLLAAQRSSHTAGLSPRWLYGVGNEQHDS